MLSILSGGRGLRPMVLAIVATLGAAGLILYFQHQTLSALDARHANRSGSSWPNPR